MSWASLFPTGLPSPPALRDLGCGSSVRQKELELVASAPSAKTSVSWENAFQVFGIGLLPEPRDHKNTLGTGDVHVTQYTRVYIGDVRLAFHSFL